MRMGRSVAKVVISAQTVVELAKNALVPVRCDATVPLKSDDAGPSSGLGSKTCGLELGSWRLLLRHQYKKHGTKRKGTAFRYACGLSRCSARLHESMEAFKSHIETSHMKNTPLPCPFTKCPLHQFGRSMVHNKFLKERDLISHFEEYHSELIGLELDPRSEILLPSWEPRPPIRPLPAPPDLPLGKIHPATFRLDVPPTIPSGWLPRVDTAADSASSSQPPPQPLGRIPQPLSRTPTLTLILPASQPRSQTPTLTLIPSTPKPSPGLRPLLPTSSALSVSSEREPETEYDFADLPLVGYAERIGGMARYESNARGLLRFRPDTAAKVPINVLAPPYLDVQRVGAGCERIELVRPLPMPQAPMRPAPLPPTAIFYESLRQQVFAEYALGEDAPTAPVY
ncbi:hypothetical protein C8R45DRAFT_957194 [Mycena sanguinolenta]|nr:hypothetical protein C8R45DRAFT_957194 [Mycena sanguinolenta]